MRTLSSVLSRFLVPTFATLVVASCSGVPGGVKDVPAGPDTIAATSASTTTTSSQPDKDPQTQPGVVIEPIPGPSWSELGSPLSEVELESPLIVLLSGGYPSANHRLAEEERRVAECMLERGWVYHSLDPTVDSTQAPATVGALLEWHRTYGYGLSTVRFVQGHSLTREAAEANESYFAVLSAADRVHYLVDLNGGVGENESPLAESCRGLAKAETPTLYDDAAVMEIVLRELEAVGSHPERVAAMREWATCMSDRAFDFLEPADAQDSVTDLFTMTDGDLAQVQAYELIVASADYECRLVTWLPVQIRLEHEIVQRVVDAFPEYAQSAP